MKELFEEQQQQRRLLPESNSSMSFPSGEGVIIIFNHQSHQLIYILLGNSYIRQASQGSSGVSITHDDYSKDNTNENLSPRSTEEAIDIYETVYSPQTSSTDFENSNNVSVLFYRDVFPAANGQYAAYNLRDSTPSDDYSKQ